MQVAVKRQPFGALKLKKGEPAYAIRDKYMALAASKPNGHLRGPDIDPKDVDYLLTMYASDPHYDVYALTDILRLTRTQLYRLLNSEKLGDAWESARNQRAGMMLQYGFNVLEETMNAARTGEANRDMVNASKNLANFTLSYAQMVSRDYNPNARDNQGAVNISISLPEFNKNVIDCGEVKVEVPDDGGV